jgi:hypothetical protein
MEIKLRPKESADSRAHCYLEEAPTHDVKHRSRSERAECIGAPAWLLANRTCVVS